MSSIKRRVEALCRECNGFDKEDCNNISCPLYPDNPYKSKDNNFIDWPSVPKNKWPEVSQLAHKREINNSDLKQFHRQLTPEQIKELKDRIKNIRKHKDKSKN